MTLVNSVKVPEDVVARKVGDEVVILNLVSGIYYGLDPVGSRMWELLVEKGSLQAVFDGVQAEYNVTGERLEGDLLRLVEELAAKGLVEVS